MSSSARFTVGMLKLLVIATSLHKITSYMLYWRHDVWYIEQLQFGLRGGPNARLPAVRLGRISWVILTRSRGYVTVKPLGLLDTQKDPMLSQCH
jgi:hypothetical protein